MQTAAMNAFAAIAGNGNHPTLPVDAVWAGVVVIVILFVFLAAAVIGPIVRALSPHQMPEGRAPIDPPSHH